MPRGSGGRARCAVGALGNSDIADAAEKQPRIAALLPSATEIVAALGFEPALVARSHECDFPESVTALPAITESKVEKDLGSADVDQRIKAIVAQGLSVYRVDAEALQQLAADIVVTQSQCEVCAISEQELVSALGVWLGTTPRIVSLTAQDIAGVWQDIFVVADVLDAARAGEMLIAALTRRMEAIRGRSSSSKLPRVACIEWTEPLMAAGNWVPELVQMAGGENLFGTTGEHSPWIDWDTLETSDPDTIVIMPCGYDLARTRSESAALTSHPRWTSLKAVDAGQVFVTDGHHYFNRPGPRLVESLEILAEIFHPDLFSFGHEGLGWQHL